MHELRPAFRVPFVSFAGCVIVLALSSRCAVGVGEDDTGGNPLLANVRKSGGSDASVSGPANEAGGSGGSGGASGTAAMGGAGGANGGSGPGGGGAGGSSGQGGSAADAGNAGGEDGSAGSSAGSSGAGGSAGTDGNADSGAGAGGFDAGAAGDGGMEASSGPPPGCPAQPLGTGDHTFTIKSANGVTYTYILSVPTTVDSHVQSPVIVSWHALDSSPEEMRSLTTVDALGTNTKSVMVYPKSPDQSWDCGSCCTTTVGGQRRDEEVFARELVADVKTKVCVDDHRIYTTGFSNGGMMSQMLACKAADLFAAAFPMGSTLTVPQSDCNFARPIPIMMVNGTADPLVGYNATGLAGGISVPSDFQLWAQKNGCTGNPQNTFQMGQASCSTYKTCKGGAETTLCSVQGMGHCVPGMKKASSTNCLTKNGLPLGMPNDDMDAITMSGQFLMRFTLP